MHPEASEELRVRFKQAVLEYASALGVMTFMSEIIKSAEKCHLLDLPISRMPYVITGQ